MDSFLLPQQHPAIVVDTTMEVPAEKAVEVAVVDVATDEMLFYNNRRFSFGKRILI